MDFAAIPPHVERLFATGHDRIVLILLDAFGRVFLERYGDHPLLRRLDVTPVDSQFPSTTAAHVTTMHTGLPVGAHGIYEWNVYEPSLDRVITPLRFTFAEGGTLPIDPRDLVPDEPCLYERLAADGVVSLVYQPDAFSPSTFDGAVVRAADIRPFRDLRAAVADAVRSVRALERGYAYVYFHAIDLVGHLSGPSSPDFDAAVGAALDAVEAALIGARDVHVLMTADHGQVDVDPTQIMWLDELHLPLAQMRLRPAGSSRDVFLHVDDVEATVAALAPHVETVAVADLVADGAFGEVGPRLRARLGDVCVLPPPGRTAWLRTATDAARHFRGHHGGLTPEETQTYLAALPL